ncbi:hypothetical protein CDAR_295631 [Caerostris darwini]|uniref:Uncharacterized protein n=1 Tax=Caerostris darwini TaxID=1538125 RepID=A0AAV4NDC8_9ARAC|nr:hypothetical protein CDAR_295631 [Caerostris darwini]
MALNRVNAGDPRDQLSSARRVETQSRSDFAIPPFAGILSFQINVRSFMSACHGCSRFDFEFLFPYSVSTFQIHCS